jgi:hypothetical protein
LSDPEPGFTEVGPVVRSDEDGGAAGPLFIGRVAVSFLRYASKSAMVSGDVVVVVVPVEGSGVDNPGADPIPWACSERPV